MQRLQYFIFLLLLSFSVSLKAQYGTQKRADALFNKFAYVKAISAYKKMVKNEYNVSHAKRRLADSYTFLRDPKNAVIYYEEVVAEEGVPIEYYFKYAKALAAVERYDEAVKWLNTYKENGGTVSDNEDLSDGSGSIFNVNPKYTIDAVSFNSEYSDFGAYEFDNILYFASTRNKGVSIKRKYSWNQQPFLDIYAIKNDLEPVSHKDRLKGINTKFHEASVSISPDGETMYFSRNSYYNNKRGRDDERITHLEIYSATRATDKRWKNVKALSINNTSYSVTHPAVSQDGKYLYFASDMPGGFGRMDIYKSEIREDGTLGVPENLGNTINTSGDDVFPFINNEGILFFSSDGHLGLGLLDIFSSVKNEAGAYIDVINLGAPINSNQDDFSFFLREDGISGYFASNRGDNVYNDDIYSFNRIPPLKVKGHVTDSITKEPIARAIMKLHDAADQLIGQVETDTNGYYEFDIERNIDYTLTTLKEDYNEKVTTFSSKNLSLETTELTVDVELFKIPEEEIPVIRSIYFNFDKANVREDAQKILDTVVYLMKTKFPKMKIRIRSHTDSRGSASYNRILSQKIANSTFKYLVSQGIGPWRITEYSGQGEEQLVTDCPDGVECTEDEHQLNRRTEFLIISIR